MLDVAYQSFYILWKGDFAFQAMRFGAAMTQVFPLVALKLGGSLAVVLKSYSLSFVLVQWLMFFICDRLLKAREIALVIFLFNIWLIAHDFFWVQNELIQGTSLCLVFWAFILKKQGKMGWVHALVAVGVILTLAFFHPLVAVSFVYIAFFLLLTPSSTLEIKKSVIVSIVAFALALAFKFFLAPAGYDAQTMERLSFGRAKQFFQHAGQSPALQMLLERLPYEFLLLPAGLLLVIGFYLHRRSFLKAGFVFFSTVGYTLVVLVSYQESRDWFHVESQFLPLSIFLVYPIVSDVLPGFCNSKKQAIYSLVVLLVIICFRLVVILDTSRFYTARIAYIAELLEKTKSQPGTKFMINDAWIDKNRLLQTWGLGYETLYYSALQSPDSTRSIAAFSDVKEEAWRQEHPHVFHARGNMARYQELPRQAFHFNDTTGFYIVPDSMVFQK